MSRASRTCDDDAVAFGGGSAGEGRHERGRAVRGGDGYVVGDVEGFEDCEAGFQHGKVRVGAHCYGDEGLSALGRGAGD